MIEISVRTRDHHDERIETVRGAPTPVPGLYVARTRKGWPVVHQRSGLTVGTYGDPEAALACAVDLGKLWDWTQGAEGLRRLPRVRKDEIVAVARRWNAIKGPSPTTWADL